MNFTIFTLNKIESSIHNECVRTISECLNIFKCQISHTSFTSIHMNPCEYTCMRDKNLNSYEKNLENELSRNLTKNWQLVFWQTKMWFKNARQRTRAQSKWKCKLFAQNTLQYSLLIMDMSVSSQCIGFWTIVEREINTGIPCHLKNLLRWASPNPNTLLQVLRIQWNNICIVHK